MLSEIVIATSLQCALILGVSCSFNESARGRIFNLGDLCRINPSGLSDSDPDSTMVRSYELSSSESRADSVV